jgi:hypothetical protein
LAHLQVKWAQIGYASVRLLDPLLGRLLFFGMIAGFACALAVSGIRPLERRLIVEFVSFEARFSAPVVIGPSCS